MFILFSFETEVYEKKGYLGQVWYLIVSIPDLCNLITKRQKKKMNRLWKVKRNLSFLSLIKPK